MKLSISGYGEHGKDELAKILKRISILKYTKSTSAYVKDEMFEYMKKLGFQYKDVEECYDDRINHREKWARFIDDFNEEDPARLYKRCLKDQDILTGVRRKHEFEAVKALDVIDICIWVERKNFHKNDTTQTYGPELCDMIILNDDLVSLRKRMIRLCRQWNILKCQHAGHVITQNYRMCQYCDVQERELLAKKEAHFVI